MRLVLVLLGLMGLLAATACATDPAARNAALSDSSHTQPTSAMEDKTEVYQGRTIEIAAQDSTAVVADTAFAEPGAAEAHGFEGHLYRDQVLTIDGTRVMIIRTEDGSFFTEHLPFQTYDDLMALAKDLVDGVPEFRPPPDSTDQ